MSGIRSRFKFTNQSILATAGVLLTCYIAWKLNNYGGIDLDSWQHIEANRSASKAHVEKRQFQHLAIFQQAGMVLTLLLIPMVVAFQRNKGTYQRHKRNWGKAFQTPAPDTSRSLEERLLRAYPQLTTYELQLCKMLVDGLSSKEIAIRLHISPASVNTARYRLRKSLDLESHVDLVKFLLQFRP